MDKITTIVGKEWSEVFKNKLVLFSVLFLPLILAVIPLVMLFAFRQAGADAAMSAELNDPEIARAGRRDVCRVVDGRPHAGLHAQPVSC
ncbi:MAG: hypothetical protein IPH95_11930 [Candidatus Promineofilum sp.]|nr:hypothetical protein [Promineifilum sp.]